MIFQNLIIRQFMWRLHYYPAYASQDILEVDTLESITSLIIQDIQNKVGRTFGTLVVEVHQHNATTGTDEVFISCIPLYNSQG